MRHYRSDVSHRMRRRPSIFSAGWFRLLLGVGLVAIVGLVVGPFLADWFWSGLTPGTQSVASAPPRASAPAPPRVSTPAPSPMPTTPLAEPREKTGPAASAAGSPPSRAARAPSEASGLATMSPSRAVPAVPSARSQSPATAGDPGTSLEPRGRAASEDKGEGVYRVQVGAFLDHRNADRLVERLRGQKLEVVDRVLEQSRLLYRVVALPAEGEGTDRLMARLSELGFAPDLAGGGAAVTPPVPLHSAVETAKQLRAQGVATRLDRQAGAAAFRVVRVGAFPSAAGAERLRAELAAQGLEGFVIRER